MSYRVTVIGTRNQVHLAVLAEQALKNFNEVQQQPPFSVRAGSLPLAIYFGEHSPILRRMFRLPNTSPHRWRRTQSLFRYLVKRHQNRNQLESLEAQLRLQVPIDQQMFEVTLLVDMEEAPLTRSGLPTREAASKATKIIAGAAAAIRQYLISINGNCRVRASMMPNTPIEYPHYLACRVGSNQQNPSEVTYFKVPHPAHFLVSCIQQISLATATIDRLRGSNVNSDVSGHVNHRNSQTRLLRLCVSLLIMSGQDDLRRSNAVWFERFKDQFILLRPSFVAEGCLTERLGLDAARWEAGIEGKGNDGRHVHALELRYSSAFRHVKHWINAKEPEQEPPTCFTRVVNEPVREGDVLLYYEVGGAE